MVTLPWRRGDPEPQKKGTVLLDAVSLLPVEKCRRISMTNEEGIFAFSGAPGGVYHLYYMPFETCEFVGGKCEYGQGDTLEGMVQYEPFARSCSDIVWWEDGDISEVHQVEYQARTEFDRFGPTEVAATVSEEKMLMDRSDGLLVATEDRSRPIRMLRHLPASWATRPFKDLSHFRGRAQPGEVYVFQIGIVAKDDIQVSSVRLASPLRTADGASIPSSALRCLNLEGVDYWGRDFRSVVDVPSGQVKALWIVIVVPENASEGRYTGSLSLGTSVEARLVTLEISVQGSVLKTRGYDDLWRGARLAWFDSKLANGNVVPPPFTALDGWSGSSVEMLDKRVTIASHGMPSSVNVGGVEALAEPIRFEVIVDGVPVELSGFPAFRADSDLEHSWVATLTGLGVQLLVRGSVDVTGYFDFNVTVNSTSASEVRLVVPSRPENAVYAAGLGRIGGLLRRWTNASSSPALWKWDGVNHNSGVWIGSSKVGLRIYAKGDDPLWQAMVPLDSDVSPPTPESWSNGGRGGIRVLSNGTVEVFTGVRPAGTSTHFFSLLATPVRPLDLPKHFNERYAQISKPMNYTKLRDGGATVVTIHQGNVVNPWINYPYLTNQLIKDAVDECHALGMKLKLYDTMREISNHALELDAMRALNETLVWREGLGGGGHWLREHLHEGYSVAWATPMQQSGFFSQQIDMAVRVKALTRWNNYYVEGLRQLIHDTGFDGIYLDEIAYDRVTMLRAKAVLGKGKLIDHHSCRGQFAKVPAVVYSEAFPFIDSLWYGEGFDYDGATPDHWLVEISGIPWGLNSDMLRYKGMTPFHFRGMLFGNANRWQDDLINSESTLENPFDPRSIWRLWDSFGISTATMYGWWLAEEATGTAPVLTNASDVKCTVFLKPGEAALLVLANFGARQSVKLSFDWNVIGLEADSVQLRAPQLMPMQPTATHWAVGDTIDVPAPEKGSKTSREGWLILVEPSADRLVV
eukprot:TRINITY_DN56063_c0_g1_i1.p1 TRINITY_DN56063_c0_g1~~TRINITY_DN56063_c0_g1_i1.p1  ORF type:complete len:1048 (-),score=123.99 TRINITY_DN56063_c0_g1_i1:122-3043(-)